MNNISSNNTDSFSKFYTYAKEYIHSERINIPSSFKLQVQKLATKKLGLENINQVRDRFEGQAFMDKLMLVMTGKYVLECHLNKEITLNTGIIGRQENKNIVQIGSKEYHLVSFYFGTLPKIINVSNLPLIFCAIRSDFKNGSVFGVLNIYSLNDKDLFSLKSNSMQSSYEFIGFNKLEKLSQ